MEEFQNKSGKRKIFKKTPKKQKIFRFIGRLGRSVDVEYLSFMTATYVFLLVVAAAGNEGPKKKKACKNCSCGLADELDAEADKAQQQQPTSSCGNVCI